MQKVRELSKLFNKSTPAFERLLKEQELIQQKPLKCLLDVRTRWNSTYLMLDRFLTLKPIIESLFYSQDKEDEFLRKFYHHRLNAEEWLVVEGLCLILKQFDKATKVLSKTLHPTSFVRAFVSGMIQIIDVRLKESEVSKWIARKSAGAKAFEHKAGKLVKAVSLAILKFLRRDL